MPIRITGMGSGLDIDKLVTDLMKAERIPLDKLKQKKTLVGWTSDLYREVNTKLTSLRKAANNIRLTGDWQNSKASSSNDNAVSATAQAGVPLTSHSVFVEKLATGAMITGAKQADNFDPSKVVIGGNGTENLIINGKPIEYKASDTLKSVMDKVNASDAGARMYYDEITKQVSIVSKDTGDLAKLDLAGSTGPILGVVGISTTLANGQNAKVIFDKGKNSPTDPGITISSASNTFTANGITYSFKEVTTEAIKINVSGNDDGMINQIKEFVDQYNATIDLLNERTKEKKSKGFNPLTEDQKSDMKETDIKNWEEQAKKGLLSNDEIIKSTLRDLRSIINGVVSSNPKDFKTLSDIGIDTMPYNAASPKDSGKLVIDESKLRKKISEDAGSIVALFTDQNNGIASKTYDQVNKSISGLVEKAGGVGSPAENLTTFLGKQLTDINKQITSFDAKLARKEEYYYKMFAAMDSAVSKNNSQLNWLMQNGR
ncbi:flagellar filament capping protein FliD [Paenibacillus terrigena]|uniref:flagellar filament capping protein FliD n=1 Tax=Paenibacillus terrigena TaxID=369333 RepID=UPI00037EE044|nr:flagellar filament capping protein FliD [Paenibacillus terrigena]